MYYYSVITVEQKRVNEKKKLKLMSRIRVITFVKWTCYTLSILVEPG